MPLKIISDHWMYQWKLEITQFIPFRIFSKSSLGDRSKNMFGFRRVPMYLLSDMIFYVLPLLR